MQIPKSPLPKSMSVPGSGTGTGFSEEWVERRFCASADVPPPPEEG
jgi:hypothetical protein